MPSKDNVFSPDRLQEAMCGMSMTDLAERLGCARSNISMTSSEHAERMVGAGLREGWRIIGVVHQFKNKEEIKK